MCADECRNQERNSKIYGVIEEIFVEPYGTNN